MASDHLPITNYPLPSPLLRVTSTIPLRTGPQFSMKTLPLEFGSRTGRSSPRSGIPLSLRFHTIRMILRADLHQAHQVKSGSGWRRRGGPAMPVGVVCCALVRVCWRIRSYTFTWGGVSLFLYFSERALMSYPDWRKPPYPVQTADYATYIQLISWFLDSPSPLCPFSVHRMALAGKDLGKEVGQWFGPSTAAGAIKCVIVFLTSFHLVHGCLVTQGACTRIPEGWTWGLSRHRFSDLSVRCVRCLTQPRWVTQETH